MDAIQDEKEGLCAKTRWESCVDEIAHRKKKFTHLHDELDGTDEETQELQDEVLLLFLHLVETVLFPSRCHIRARQTGARAGLQQLLRYGTGSAGLNGFLFVIIDGGVLGLKLLDQGVNVFVLFLLAGSSIFLGGDVVGDGIVASAILFLFVESARRHVSAEVVCRLLAGRVGVCCVGHGDGLE